MAQTLLGLITCVLVRQALSLNKTGQVYNSVYKIEHYYGARDKEFYQHSSLILNELAVVKWTNAFDIDFS